MQIQFDYCSSNVPNVSYIYQIYINNSFNEANLHMAHIVSCVNLQFQGTPHVPYIHLF